MSSRKPHYADVIKATQLIFFFGTPHGGSHYLDKSKVWLIEKLAKAASYKIPENLKSVLAPKADDLFSINDEFPQVKGDIAIVNFYEQKTMTGLDDLVSAPNILVWIW